MSYWQRCCELLAEPLPDDASDNLVLPMSEDARSQFGAGFERIEKVARRGELRAVKPFALRATEQACRLAGVPSAFAGRDTVCRDTARNALALVAYSLDTWRAVIEQGAADQGGMHALRLYEWLTERPGWKAKLLAILHGGPACVRTKDKRDAALDLLGELGLVEVAGGMALALMPEVQSSAALPAPNCWRIWSGPSLPLRKLRILRNRASA